MEQHFEQIPIVISALAVGSSQAASTSLTAQRRHRGAPASYRTVRLARLDAADLEAIRLWLRGEATQLYVLTDLHVLHRDVQVVTTLESLLQQAGFRIVSVSLWMLVPLWAAEGLRSSIDNGPVLQCRAATDRQSTSIAASRTKQRQWSWSSVAHSGSIIAHTPNRLPQCLPGNHRFSAS